MASTPMVIQTQVAGLNQTTISYMLNINQIHNSTDIPYIKLNIISYIEIDSCIKHIEIILQTTVITTGMGIESYGHTIPTLIYKL